jgi:2-C-methyl-D-erythritol 4-phosphate cytidylyltransferase
MDDVAGIVLAAGGGARFGAPKQFLELEGIRLVDRALALLEPHCAALVLALPAGHGVYATPSDAPQQTGAATRTVTVTGGPTRLESVARALAALPASADIVVVHDCVRPNMPAAVVARLIEAIRAGADAAIPCWTPPDVVKRRREDGTIVHLGREDLAVAQSPNACRVAALRHALDQPHTDRYVEETQAIEATGGRVVAVEGDRWANHIVDARDLDYARCLLGRERT